MSHIDQFNVRDNKRMKIRIINAIVFLVILILGCQTVSSNNEQHNITPNTAILKTTLGTLNIDNPEKDLDENIRNKDLRFICICGYACYTPRVEQSDLSLTKKYGIKCLDGTSDLIESDEHAKLIKDTIKYAERYNGLLLKEIKNRP